MSGTGRSAAGRLAEAYTARANAPATAARSAARFMAGFPVRDGRQAKRAYPAAGGGASANAKPRRVGPAGFVRKPGFCLGSRASFQFMGQKPGFEASSRTSRGLVLAEPAAAAAAPAVAAAAAAAPATAVAAAAPRAVLTRLGLVDRQGPAADLGA